MKTKNKTIYKLYKTPEMTHRALITHIRQLDEVGKQNALHLFNWHSVEYIIVNCKNNLKTAHRTINYKQWVVLNKKWIYHNHNSYITHLENIELANDRLGKDHKFMEYTDNDELIIYHDKFYEFLTGRMTKDGKHLKWDNPEAWKHSGKNNEWVYSDVKGGQKYD